MAFLQGVLSVMCVHIFIASVGKQMTVQGEVNVQMKQLNVVTLISMSVPSCHSSTSFHQVIS